MVLVGGEAGIGKTALVERFCSGLDRTTRVLIGACDAMTTPRPLGPLFDMSESVGTRFVQAMTSGKRDAIFEGLLHELRTGRPPLVLVVQDVHWADDATLDLLRFLGRRIGSTRALAIVTYRDDEVGTHHPLRTVLGDLATSASVGRLTVPALSLAAVARLAEGSGTDAAELHRTTGGNPFFVTEVLAAGGSAPPATVQDAVSARTSRLPDGARRLLEVASVIGAEVDPALLTELGASPEELEATIDSGMLRTAGTQLAFRHELVREAVYRALSGPRRATLHRRVLAALSRAGHRRHEAAVLAHHAAEAGDAEAVLRHAPEAARSAAKLRAHREARAQYARTLPYLSELADDLRAELLDAYATECTIVDRFEEGASARRGAIDAWRRIGRPKRAGLGLSLLAQAELGLGRDAEATAANDEAIRMLEPLGPSLELGRAYWYAAVLRGFAGDAVGAADWGTRSIEMCRSLGELSMQANAHNVVGSALLGRGDAAGHDHLARALALGQELGLPELIADVRTSAGVAANESHRFEEAAGELTAAVAIAIEHDHDNIHHSALASLALALLHLGRWDEATDAALSVLGRPHVSAHARADALVVLGRLRARRGDPDAAEVLDEALDLATAVGTPRRVVPIRAARAEAAFLAGDADNVRTEVDAARAFVDPPSQPWLDGEMAYWLWKIDPQEHAPTGAAEPFALQIDGRAQEAASAWDRLGCPYEAARARAETDRPDVVREALDAFAELGARPAAALAAKRLRDLGVRGVPRGPRPDTLSHPALLTGREAQVLALLAQGLRNQEIAARHAVSTRTVDHQVSSLLAKLGVRSRMEAVAEAHRLGLLPQDRHDETQR